MDSRYSVVTNYHYIFNYTGLCRMTEDDPNFYILKIRESFLRNINPKYCLIAYKSNLGMPSLPLPK